MIVNDLLEKENMSRYRLSKESGVAMQKRRIYNLC